MASGSAVLEPVPGWNGLSCEATVRVGFREVGGAGREDFRTGTQTLLITPGVHAAGDVLTMTPAAATLVPTSGAAKDKASGSFGMSYVVGSLSEPDTFRLQVSTGTSAMTARHSFAGGAPVPVDAFVTGRIAIRTFEPLTDRTLRLPAVPSLISASTETMAATFYGRGGGATPSGYILPGHDGVDERGKSTGRRSEIGNNCRGRQAGDRADRQ